MSEIPSNKGKRIALFCVLFACLFTVFAAKTTYAAPVNDKVKLTVKQSFIQEDGANATDSFHYRFTADHSTNPMPLDTAGDVYEFSIQGTGSVEIGPITFSVPGTYTYQLAQYIDYPKTGYRYDRQVYVITIYVDYDLQIAGIIKNEDGEKVETPHFENKYQPIASDPSLMVDPPVKKVVTGNPVKDSTFTFQLEAKNKTNPMPAGSSGGIKTISIVGSGESEFGKWKYSRPGIYEYTVSEVNSGEDRYIYDDMIYTITDNVKDIGGKLVLNRTVNNSSGVSTNTFLFTNQYTSDDLPGTGDNGETDTKNPPQQSGDNSSVKTDELSTGDHTNVIVYSLTLSGGSFILFFLFVNRKRREKR